MTEELETPENPGELVEFDDPDRVLRLASALHADLQDLATYAKVLTETFVTIFGPEIFEIEYDRSLSDRVAGRLGTVKAIRANLGEQVLELTSRRGSLVGSVARLVRGVVISRREVDLDEWSHTFAQALEKTARANESARAALARMLGTS